MYEITDFFELHFLLQFMYAFTFTFVFFVFIMEYKVFALRLKKKGFLYINSDSLPLKLLGYVYLAFAYISFYSLG